MSLPIYVDAYSGFKANERSEAFTLDEHVYECKHVVTEKTLIEPKLT
jgi:hypothetical protein